MSPSEGGPGLLIWLGLALFLMAAFVAMGLAFLVYAVAGIWLAICLAWAPFAGWLLVRASPGRLDSPWDTMQRFLFGAAMSALFLAPWIYSFRHYKGKRRISASRTRSVYRALYFVWMAGALQQALLFSIAGAGIYILSPDSYPTVESYLVGAITPLAVLLLQVGAFIWSRRGLRRRLEEDRKDAAADEFDSPAIGIQAHEYLRPFVLVYACTVLGILHYGFVALPSLCGLGFDLPASLLPACT